MAYDGSVTITTSKNINTDILAAGRSHADGVTYNVTAFGESGGKTTITTSGNPNGIVAGDEILVICTQGRTGNVTNVGNYELLKVEGVSSNIITCMTLKTKYYGTGASDDSNIGVSNNISGYSNVTNDNRVVVQRVPNYVVLTITGGGILTCDYRSCTLNGWDGTTSTHWTRTTCPLKGGIVAFKARKLVLDGSIDVSGKGFQGGWTSYSWGHHSKTSQCCGESIDTTPNASADCTIPVPAHYGAGGSGAGWWGESHWPGSGGYGTIGGGGAPGGTYGASSLDKLFLGSSAGSRHASEPNTRQAGGAGGGLIYIDAVEVSGNGYIRSKGTPGSFYTVTGSNAHVLIANLSGGEYGGSGGSIFIYYGRVIPGTIALQITGGAGSYAAGGSGRSKTTLKAEEALGGGLMLI